MALFSKKKTAQPILGTAPQPTLVERLDVLQGSHESGVAQARMAVSRLGKVSADATVLEADIHAEIDYLMDLGTQTTQVRTNSAVVAADVNTAVEGSTES